MNNPTRLLMLIVLGGFLSLGCSSGETRNITGNASQAEIDNYNKLLEQADKEMEGDGEIEKDE